MIKEKYINAELDIIKFKTADIIVTSGEDFDPDPNEGNPVVG